MDRRMVPLPLALVFALVVSIAPVRAQDADIKTAQVAGEAWLSLVDSERYAESWTESAAFFRSAVPQDKWVALAKTARTPFGALKSRMVAKSTSAKSLPGAPDGEYVVLDYSASYEQKAAAFERLTLMREKDGGWRVVGYFIK